jgi:hypothetical protein
MVRVFLRGGSSLRPASPAWIVAAGLGLAVFFIVVLFLGTILTMIVAPFAIGLALVGRWRLRRLFRQFDPRRTDAPPNAPAASGRIIDADYRVIDRGDRG